MGKMNYQTRRYLSELYDQYGGLPDSVIGQAKQAWQSADPDAKDMVRLLEYYLQAETEREYGDYCESELPDLPNWLQDLLDWSVDEIDYGQIALVWWEDNKADCLEAWGGFGSRGTQITEPL